MKRVSPSSENVYLDESFIPASVKRIFGPVETYSFIQSFVQILKIRRWQLFYDKSYCCSQKLIFSLVEVNFFRFLDTPATESKISSSGNVFLNELFITYCGD